MASTPKEYTRLPGRGFRREGFLAFSSSRRRTRLWLGADHLLSVESVLFKEDYRRFYFRDIQSVIIRKTKTGMIINAVLASLAAICLISMMAAGRGWNIFWMIAGSIFLFFLIFNSLFGPTSICHIRTAVQTEELPSLRRLRRARRVMDRLRPLIIQAQGELPAADAAQEMPPASAPEPIQPPPPADAPPAQT